jgi:dihydrodipicolinate synthase/N-acetylneuraminate lyase
VLLAVVLAVGAWTALARHRRRVANRYRREALEELVAIEGGIGARESRVEALAEVPPLIKRVALAVVSRADAASLTGDAWLAFLDGSYGGDGFTNGPGRLIPELAYQSAERQEAVSQQQAKELIELVRVWIQSHELTATDAA